MVTSIIASTKMKITEQTKSCQTFAYGKLNGLNNRESARLCLLIPEGIDANKISANAVAVYLAVCREPNVNALNYAANNNEGNPSRSKLVMAYEKHRKAFKKIVENRTIQKSVCDVVAESISSEELSSAENVRAFFLSKLLTNSIR